MRRGGVEGAARLHPGVSGAGARPALCKRGCRDARPGREVAAGCGVPAGAGRETCGKRRLQGRGARLPPAGRQTPAPGAERRAPSHLAVCCGAQPAACQLLHGASEAGARLPGLGRGLALPVWRLVQPGPGWG